MTSTERLRAMLDERGVEHVDAEDGHTQHTWWSDGDHEICASASGMRLAVYNLTPEQAIAATLGAEPDDTAMLKLHDRMNAALLEYERALGSEKADGAITVPFVAEMHHLLEEATTLGDTDATEGRQRGAGTCHIEGFDDGIDEALDGEPIFTAPTWYLSCGHEVEGTERPRFCARCGREVVDE